MAALNRPRDRAELVWSLLTWSSPRGCCPSWLLKDSSARAVQGGSGAWPPAPLGAPRALMGALPDSGDSAGLQRSRVRAEAQAGSSKASVWRSFHPHAAKQPSHSAEEGRREPWAGAALATPLPPRVGSESPSAHGLSIPGVSSPLPPPRRRWPREAGREGGRALGRSSRCCGQPACQQDSDGGSTASVTPVAPGTSISRRVPAFSVSLHSPPPGLSWGRCFPGPVFWVKFSSGNDGASDPLVFGWTWALETRVSASSRGRVRKGGRGAGAGGTAAPTLGSS